MLRQLLAVFGWRAKKNMPAETRRLAVITAWLLVLTLVHDVDHVRQGRSLPAVLYLVAVSAVASLGATLMVLFRWPQWARPVAVAQGLATVAGVGAVHAGPQWSRFVDSYSTARADALSWAIIMAMMASGAVLAAVAIVAGGVAEA